MKAIFEIVELKVNDVVTASGDSGNITPPTEDEEG